MFQDIGYGSRNVNFLLQKSKNVFIGTYL